MASIDRFTLSYNCGPKGRAGQGGKGSTRFSVLALTASNIIAQDTLSTAYASAAAPLTQATVTRRSTDHGVNISGTPPAAPLNKGEKWVVTMQEDTGNQRIFTHTIPAADESGTHKLPNTLNWDPTDSDWIAYANAVGAYVTTPDGAACTMNFATLLTRRR
jgi:hypothetical protein